MTKAQIDVLCKELKEVIHSKITPDQMTEAQLVFWVAFEDASFDKDLLAAYSDMIEFTPDISLRNLHSFVMGHAFGVRYGGKLSNTDTKKTH
jgi:hypothetical protein